jgi:hypothetical protein
MKKSSKKLASPTCNKNFVLGKGKLNWQRCERVCDRYGAVNLGGETPSIPDNLEGKYGVLSVKVIQGRPSGHMGDLFHGFVQTVVHKAGKVLVLGEGYLFEEEGSEGEK